jgi:hypothetical protein
MASSRLLLAVALVAGCAVGLSGATDHIVGANHGWNPNINYTLWSGNQTFFVGDLICKPLPLQPTSVFFTPAFSSSRHGRSSTRSTTFYSPSHPFCTSFFLSF